MAFSACAVLGHWLAWAPPLWPYWLLAGALAMLLGAVGLRASRWAVLP